jgi:hypothetical protein
MKNKLSDLNKHLFEAIEWLGDRSIKGEALAEEIRRANAICGVSTQIVAAGKLVLEAIKAADELPGVQKIPLLLE